MAGFFQVGDFVNFGRLAWQVYQYGWREEHNAAKQYLEFGRDVRGLAQSLDILERVVVQAQQSLVQQGLYNVPLRWDKVSLVEIIGDYEQTLQECRFLVEDNYRYRVSAGPIRNLEWNALVQPNADRLRTRLLLHNSKIQLVLKPFEIDLLSRIRQDINRVRQDVQRAHQDLARRIEAVHLDVLRLIGVMVPDLEHALAQQEERSLHFLDIPPRIADAFGRAAFHNRPNFDTELGLEEMADAFVLHYRNSTREFKSGLVVESRIPPLDQYVNLLKCIWLMQRIRSSSKLEEAYAGSHWPSYISQLETDLSLQCERFHPKQELIGPDLNNVTPHMLAIWPETQALPLVDVVTQEELMEEVLDVSLNGGTGNVKRRLQMLRRTGQDNKRFRVNISGSETDVTGKVRRHVETIDFDLTSALVNPLYALPSRMGGLDIILRKDERIARLAFQRLKDVLKFQHAVTGFEPKSAYAQYNAEVTFVLDGRREALVERACVQLWVPKQREGKVMTSRDAAPEAYQTPASPFPQSPAVDTGVFEMIASPTSYSGGPFFTQDPFAQQRSFDTSTPFSQPGRIPRSDTMASAGSLPTQRIWGSPQPGQSIPRRPVNGIPSSPGSHASRQSTVDPMQIPGSPQARNVYFPMRSSSQQLSPPVESRTRDSSISTAHSRTFSISSDISQARSNTSSSGSDAPTVTVTTGGNTTGTLHLPPTRPMLVLFTQDPMTNRLALVAFPLDEETGVNPGLCFCSRSGRDGASCRIASLQRRGGKSEMEARRFESSAGEADWNIAKLARGWRDPKTGSSGAWKGVTRISIQFPDAEARAKFAGTPNLCGCKIRLESDLKACIEKNHRGLIGEVQERFRRDANKYHKIRAQTQHVVVNGLPGIGGSVS